jgi:hypothetical protein
MVRCAVAEVKTYLLGASANEEEARRLVIARQLLKD